MEGKWITLGFCKEMVCLACSQRMKWRVMIELKERKILYQVGLHLVSEWEKKKKSRDLQLCFDLNIYIYKTPCSRCDSHSCIINKSQCEELHGALQDHPQSFPDICKKLWHVSEPFLQTTPWAVWYSPKAEQTCCWKRVLEKMAFHFWPLQPQGNCEDHEGEQGLCSEWNFRRSKTQPSALAFQCLPCVTSLCYDRVFLRNHRLIFSGHWVSVSLMGRQIQDPRKWKKVIKIFKSCDL